MQHFIKNHAMPYRQSMVYQHDCIAMCGSTLTQLYHWSGFGAMDFAVQMWSPWSPATISSSILLNKSSFCSAVLHV